MDGFESIDQSGQHQKLNVLKKRAFHFLAGEGWWMGFESITQPGQSSEVERNPKKKHFIFLAGEGWWMGFESIDKSGQHQKLNVIQK